MFENVNSDNWRIVCQIIVIIYVILGEIQRPANTVTTYSLPTGAAYYYDAAGGNLTAARSFAPSSGSFAVVPQSAAGAIRTTQVHGELNIYF